MENNKTLVLVDGSSYLFRAYHALPALTNTKGMPTGAAYGVLNMLRKLINDYQPEYVAVVFDSKEATIRHEIFPEYKANRDAMPEELAVQIKPLHDMIKAMGLPLVVMPGVEADDIIGTLAKEATKAGLKTVISTGDKDMAQLVDDHVTLINTMNDTVMDAQGVQDKFHVTPEQIIDYLTLVGDSVDNIPGVPKVGPKTAAKWLAEYSSLDNLIEHAGEIKGKVGEYFRESIDYLPLTKRLVTIICDIELPFEMDALVESEPDNTQLQALYAEMEFKLWLTDVVVDQPVPKTTYEQVLTEAAFNAWIQRLNDADEFSFDTETTSLNYMDAEIVGVSFAVQSGEAAYVPVAHCYEGAPEQLNREAVLEKLRPLLCDPNKKVIGQNLKYDMSVLANHGVEFVANACDTMLESYVLDSTSNRHDMDTNALKYLGRGTIHFEDVAGKGKKQVTFDYVDLEQATPYAAEDADITLQLHQTLMPKLEADEALLKVFNQIEMPLMPVLSRIERNGVLIDGELLAKQSERLGLRLGELAKEVYQLADGEFNLASPKQLQEVLFERMGLPIIKKTPKGQPSTAEDVLQELALSYPLPKLILEYRSLSKLKSTYADKLPLMINARTGRVHTSYNQAVTSTGRLSSTDPNLQNIPVRTEEGRMIRQAFIAPEGYNIVAADYSQIELRIMAELSQDKGLLDAFAQGLDIHKATAAEIFDCSVEDVTKDQRRSAKAINFGLIYGMSAFGLAKQLNVERKVAQQYMDFYFEKYPGVQTYMNTIREQAHEKGYVETWYGNKLMLAEINAKNMMRRKAAERAAINAPMQGTAAEIIKLAMICVDKWLQASKVDAKMIMQVHDELVFEVAKDHTEELVQNLRACMTQDVTLSVPILVDIGIGTNWDEAH